MKTIHNLKLENKKVLIRCDFNVPIKNGKIIDDTRIKVDFDQKQRAITPGQFVVLYDENERCLGGGVIESFYRN